MPRSRSAPSRAPWVSGPRSRALGEVGHRPCERLRYRLPLLAPSLPGQPCLFHRVPQPPGPEPQPPGPEPHQPCDGLEHLGTLLHPEPFDRRTRPSARGPRRLAARRVEHAFESARWRAACAADEPPEERRALEPRRRACHRLGALSASSDCRLICAALQRQYGLGVRPRSRFPQVEPAACAPRDVSGIRREPVGAERLSALGEAIVEPRAVVLACGVPGEPPLDPEVGRRVLGEVRRTELAPAGSPHASCAECQNPREVAPEREAQAIVALRSVPRCVGARRRCRRSRCRSSGSRPSRSRHRATRVRRWRRESGSRSTTGASISYLLDDAWADWTNTTGQRSGPRVGHSTARGVAGTPLRSGWRGAHRGLPHLWPLRGTRRRHRDLYARLRSSKAGCGSLSPG